MIRVHGDLEEDLRQSAERTAAENLYAEQTGYRFSWCHGYARTPGSIEQFLDVRCEERVSLCIGCYETLTHDGRGRRRTPDEQSDLLQRRQCCTIRVLTWEDKALSYAWSSPQGAPHAAILHGTTATPEVQFASPTQPERPHPILSLRTFKAIERTQLGPASRLECLGPHLSRE
jgi:hypothetical protein